MDESPVNPALIFGVQPKRVDESACRLQTSTEIIYS